jgi:hypothetical protein
MFLLLQPAQSAARYRYISLSLVTILAGYSLSIKADSKKITKK